MQASVKPEAHFEIVDDALNQFCEVCPLASQPLNFNTYF